jgi:hypothetical protein
MTSTRIFISYCSRDRAIASELAGELAGLGYEVWFDREIAGGELWWEKILKSIREANLFVFLLTPDSLSSDACRREYLYAASLNKRILPILAASGVDVLLLPPQLQAIQYVDYRPGYAGALESLTRALGSLPPELSPPDSLPPPPEAPVSPASQIIARIEQPVLSMEEQATLILELAELMRQSYYADDAVVALRLLSRHQGLLASTEHEIDQILYSWSRRTVFAGPAPGSGLGARPPMSEPAIHVRYSHRAALDYALRLIPEADFRLDGQLGPTERKYVFVGDYAEQRGRSLRQILSNLWMGDAFEKVSRSNARWVALVFEVGDGNVRKYDLMPATWKAIFRILSDPKRLGYVQPSLEEIEKLGPTPHDYYSNDQNYWYSRVTAREISVANTRLRYYEALHHLFGIDWLCFRGDGITYRHGDNTTTIPSRLFLLRNVPVDYVIHRVFDLGSVEDNRDLQ